MGRVSRGVAMKAGLQEARSGRGPGAGRGPTLWGDSYRVTWGQAPVNYRAQGMACSDWPPSDMWPRGSEGVEDNV